MCIFDSQTALEVSSKVRLPETVFPQHYELILRPDLKAFTFSGDVTIAVQVRKPVSQIVLNAAELTISSAVVYNADGSRLNGHVTLDEQNERATIAFDGVLGKGDWSLALEFAGILNNKLHGFYRSTYKDSAGKEHVIASTQFEPTDARRAFPCFDEPAFKATFGITLEVDEDLTAISNGRIESVRQFQIPDYKLLGPEETGPYTVVETPERKKAVRFGKTMKMSTYLVAFVVGEFEASAPVVVNGTEVRVYCVPGKKHLATFSLKAAQFALTYFEKYFGIKYPGDKLDMIGIPDFAFGAMENLGCVTYRETALLVNEQTATIAELLRVSEVVAHEIAHMWFGDLVTMKWWNGLWLNEAFATFMATKVQAAFRPHWERWNSFAIERAAAFRTDGLAATRAIEAPVIHPADALGMIDVITYRKGCSVLRQLEQFLGEDNFRDGIRVYLKKHAYGNATGDDLWSAIQSVNPTARVLDIQNSWIFQPGYPVVSISESEVTGCVTLSQRPFKYLPEALETDQQWLAPVCLRFKADGEVREQWLLLAGREQTIYLGENLEWVVANAGGNCFHRVQYSPSLAGKITANINENLTAIERFNLVNDAWACVQAGLQSAPEFLEVVKLFAQETDSNVWTVVAKALGQIGSVVPAAQKAQFQKFVRDLATPRFTQLGWKARQNDSAQDRQVRGILLALVGGTGNDQSVQFYAKRFFTQYVQDNSAVDADLVPALVSLVAQTGGKMEYDEFLRLLQETNVPQEQIRYLHALASFRDKDLLAQTLTSTTSGAVRSQDSADLVIKLLANPGIKESAWSFVKANWDYFVSNLPETKLITLTSGVIALDTPELEADVQAFFAVHKVKGGEKAVAQNLESLRINVLSNQRETDGLKAHFSPEA